MRSVLEPATASDHTSLVLSFLLFANVIIPEAIIIVVVVDGDEMLVCHIMGSLNTVNVSILLDREVCEALLYSRVKLVLLDGVLLLVDLSTFLFHIRLAHLGHQVVEHVRLASLLIFINATAHEKSIELFLGSIVITIILCVRAQLCHVDDVEIQLLHHLLAVFHGNADFVRVCHFGDDLSERPLDRPEHRRDKVQTRLFLAHVEVWLVVLKRKKCLAHELILTGPNRQGLVVGPQALAVRLLLEIWHHGHALLDVAHEVVELLVVLQDLGELSEDGPALKRLMQLVIGHRGIRLNRWQLVGSLHTGEDNLRGAHILLDGEVSLLEESELRPDVEVIFHWVQLIRVEEVVCVALVDAVSNADSSGD